MSELGSPDPLWSADGQDPRYTTICHHGDGFNLNYHADSHHFYCYSNCGAMDIYQLVANVKASQGFDLTFPETVKLVADLTGKSFTVSRDLGKSNEKISDWEWIEKVTKKKKKPNQALPSYDESVLDVFMSYRNNWMDENITPDIAEKYNIGYYFKEDQITIPHYSVDGRLIGIRSRNTDERADMGMKYIPTRVANIQYRHIVSYNLYGLNHTKEAIQRMHKVMFYEGEKSVLKAEKMYGNDNFTVAVSGSNISSHQRDLVLNLGVEEVFIAFDRFRGQKKNEPDKVYKRWIEDYQRKLVRLAHLFTPYCRVYILWCDDGKWLDYKDSPADNGREVLEDMMLNKIEIQTKDVIF